MEENSSEKRVAKKRPSIFKQKRLWVGCFIVLAAIGFLGYKGFQVSSIPQMTVSQFVAKEAQYTAKTVKLEGNIGNWHEDVKAFQHTFTVSEGGQTVDVSYTGTVPDLFKDGAPVLVTGKYQDGLFTASPNGVSTQCASKYVPAISTPNPTQ